MGAVYRISIVEDEKNIREELRILLQNSGYEADCITDFSHASDYILNSRPDLVLLDVNLPAISGLIICNQIRAKSDIPIIFVTSNRTSMDELNCILRGGDDYISKPYQVPILLARIAALLKRTSSTKMQSIAGVIETEIVCGKLTLNIANAVAMVEKEKIELTRNEMKILYYLMKHKGTFVARADLIEYLCDNEVFIDDNTLSVNMTRIRGKLAEAGVTDYIETKRGMGYRVCD